MGSLFSSIFEFFSDMMFVLKIFVFIAIIGFVNRHIQTNIVKIVMLIFMGYIVLFVKWSTFGTLWVIYTLLGMGVSGMLVDFFFVTAQSGPEGEMPQHMLPEEGEGGLQRGAKEAIHESSTPTPSAMGSQGKNAPRVKPPMIRRPGG